MYSTPLGLEHYCRTVSPREWKGVTLQMMTACFDGAGKDTSQYGVMVVAGFSSVAGVWREFETLWKHRLDKDHLPFFHPGRLAHFEAPFDSWKGDEPRIRSLTGDLMEIIKSCGLRKFGCILMLEHYRNVMGKRVKQGVPKLDCFAFAALKAVDDYHAFAKAEGIKHNVKSVFEKGDPEDHLRKLFREYGHEEPHFTWSKTHTDQKGFTHDPFLGLQAAGWIAYEFYLDAHRLYFEKPTERWALKQFQTLPGQLKFMYDKERVLQPKVTNPQEIFESLRTSIQHLEKARKDGL